MLQEMDIDQEEGLLFAFGPSCQSGQCCGVRWAQVFYIVKKWEGLELVLIE